MFASVKYFRRAILNFIWERDPPIIISRPHTCCSVYYYKIGIIFILPLKK